MRATVTSLLQLVLDVEQQQPDPELMAAAAAAAATPDQQSYQEMQQQLTQQGELAMKKRQKAAASSEEGQRDSGWKADRSPADQGQRRHAQDAAAAGPGSSFGAKALRGAGVEENRPAAAAGKQSPADLTHLQRLLRASPYR
jgi:hypothetical protein